jgi:hypothetical protein
LISLTFYRLENTSNELDSLLDISSKPFMIIDLKLDAFGNYIVYVIFTLLLRNPAKLLVTLPKL